MDTEESTRTTERPFEGMVSRASLFPGLTSSDLPDVPTSGSRPSDGSTLMKDDTSVGAVFSEMEGLIQRYPWPTLFLGIGVGYLLARRLR